MKMKECSICKEILPVTEFLKNNKNFRTWCRSCGRKRDRDYYHKNKIKRYQQSKKHRAKYKEKYNEIIRNFIRERSRKQKLILVEEHGGKCIKCGYNKFISALHFHHRDPSQKSFHLNGSRSLETKRKEAQKCDLLCANCHAEHTHGY